MRNATRRAARGLGLAAAIAGFEHGLFEVLQGNIAIQPGMIVSFGPPCVPEEVWNACEPAATILPNMLLTGILAMLISAAMLYWLFTRLDRRGGGLVMVALSIALLLFGGGIFPPVIGLVAGFAAMGINKPFKREHGKGYTALLRVLAKLAPWVIGWFLLQVFGQWIVGYAFNALMMRMMWLNVILILLSIPASIWCAYGRDYTDWAKTHI